MDPKKSNSERIPHFERKRILPTPKAMLNPREMGMNEPGMSQPQTKKMSQQQQLEHSLSKYLTYHRYNQEKHAKNIELGGIKICTDGTYFKDNTLQTVFEMPPELVAAVAERQKINDKEETLKENKKRKKQEESECSGEEVKKPKMHEEFLFSP